MCSKELSFLFYLEKHILSSKATDFILCPKEESKTDAKNITQTNLENPLFYNTFNGACLSLFIILLSSLQPCTSCGGHHTCSMWISRLNTRLA